MNGDEDLVCRKDGNVDECSDTKGIPLNHCFVCGKFVCACSEHAWGGSNDCVICSECLDKDEASE